MAGLEIKLPFFHNPTSLLILWPTVTCKIKVNVWLVAVVAAVVYLGAEVAAAVVVVAGVVVVVVEVVIM